MVSTAAPQPVDGSTPVTAPDTTGLPLLSEPDPAIVVGQLDNGLRYFIRDNDNPGRRVEMRLAVDAGSALEDDSQDGGAHFLEHMVFKGSNQLPAGEFDRQVEALGGNSNAATGFDDVHYHVLIPPAAAAKALELLLDLVLQPRLDGGDFAMERQVVLEELLSSCCSPLSCSSSQPIRSSWCQRVSTTTWAAPAKPHREGPTGAGSARVSQTDWNHSISFWR